MRTPQRRLNRSTACLGALLATLVVGLSGVWPAHGVEPIRPGQWHLDSWKIEEAWKISQGEGITVAVIDSGVDLTHPDLAGQVTLSDFDGGANKPTGHGTSMASLIVGTGKGVDGRGAFGVAPKARVLAFSIPEWGNEMLDSAKSTAAIRMAADSPAKIINLSFGGSQTRASAEAIAYALSKGKLVIAGSGNVGETKARPVYPASDTGVLGVGGYDQSGKVWSGSVTGNWVSLAGPSADVVSACTGATRYCKANGTSDATALTSGVAALLWAQHPEYTANQIIKVLIDSANKPEGPLPNDSLGYGNVSPRNALNWTGDPGPPDVNPLVGKRGDAPTASPKPSGTGEGSRPPAATPSNGAQPAPKAGAATAGAVADDSDDGSSNTLVVVAGAVGAVLVLALLIGLFVRSRRGRNGPGGPPGPGGPGNSYPPQAPGTYPPPPPYQHNQYQPPPQQPPGPYR